MFDRRLIPAAVLLALVLSGCGAETAAPSATRPVLQALLVAGDSLQTAWVEWRVPAESGFGIAVRPVDANLVRLSLVLPDGRLTDFVPVPGVPGRFDAVVGVVSGSRYGLVGTVDGASVAAETTIPEQLNIYVPQDTGVVTGTCTVCSVPFQWSAGGAAGYLYLHSQTDTSGYIDVGSTRDTVGVVHLLRLLSRQTLTHLTVLALEAQAASFLTVRTPKSSLRGIFGLFGAASPAERWIVWR
jgi:hypothetical protein